MAEINNQKIDAYIPDQRKAREEKQERDQTIPKYDRRNFIYDQAKDEYICPQGKLLLLKEVSKNGTKRYIGQDLSLLQS